MYFAKDEIIELNDNRKYLVLDTFLIDNKVYYKVQRINNDENQKEDEIIYLTAENKEGKILINENLTIEELNKIEDIQKDFTI